ncbi:MAG TPA: hypothetical protein DCZ76_07620 [Treponema sp.]|nr:hypothetical protein [Treponema sp.]
MSKKVKHGYVTAFLMFILLIFPMYRLVKNTLLLVRHESVSAEIVSVEYNRGTYRGNNAYYLIEYKYEEDGNVKRGETKLSHTIVRMIKGTRRKKLQVGTKTTIYIGNNGYSFLKDELTEEIIRYAIYSLVITFIICRLLDFFEISFEKKNKNYFYFQLKNYKIKKLSAKKIGNICDYIEKLEKSELVSFGFSMGSSFYEYSYGDGIFYERLANGKSEKENEINDRDKAEERIRKIYRLLIMKS